MTSVTNVCEILIIADLHQSENLKKEAMQFLINNAKEVRAEDELTSRVWRESLGEWLSFSCQLALVAWFCEASEMF